MGQVNGKERAEDGSVHHPSLHHHHHRASSSAAADAGYPTSHSDPSAAAAALHALAHSHHHSSSSLPPTSTSFPNGSFPSSASAQQQQQGAIQLPPPDHVKKFPKKFDHGLLEPQGVYTGPQDYHHDIVKTLITTRRLAPFYKGADDEETYRGVFEGKVQQTECPICFLYYPSTLNQTRCCEQPICTECFVQIKRADPTHTKPPSSQPAACPYCMVDEFGVVYFAPRALVEARKMKGSGSGSSFSKSSLPSIMGGGSSSSSSAAAAVAAGQDSSALDSGFSIREAPSATAEEVAAAAVSGNNASHQRRRKSFNANDPQVITTDQIRPDWQVKLQAAEAAIARRANRRIIMRQVGDRLIPVGVSSSRLGSELPLMGGAVMGPGGAIILQEGQSLQLPPGFLASGPSAGSGSSSRSARQAAAAEGAAQGTAVAAAGGQQQTQRGSTRQRDLARYLHSLGSGQDLEEAMMLEAMRLSLVEHEEQQRKQAEEERKKRQQRESTSAEAAGSQPVEGAATAPAEGSAAGSSAADGSSAGGANGSSPSKRRSGRVSMLQSSGTMEQDLAEMLGGGVVETGSARARSSAGQAATTAAPAAPVVAAEHISDAGRVVDPSVAAADVIVDSDAPTTASKIASTAAAAEGRASAFAADSSVPSEAALKAAAVHNSASAPPPPEAIAVPTPVSPLNASASTAMDVGAQHSKTPSSPTAAERGSPTLGKATAAPTKTEDAQASVSH